MFPLTRGSGISENIAIDGDRVIWTENNDLYLFNIGTGVQSRVTTDPSTRNFARISGNRIVYMDGRKGYWHVFMTDLSTGTEIPIGTGTVSEIDPDISGDRIVWMDARNHRNEIWLYDLSTGIETMIAPDAVNPHQPAISGDKVTFTDVRDGNTDIYLYDLATGTETRVTTDPGYQVYSDVDGNTIVWADARNGAMDIYAYDIPGRTETRISSDAGSEQFPRISGNIITWQWTSPAGIPNIVTYDIQNRVETQVTDNTQSKGVPEVSGDRVVWREAGDGGPVVYLYDPDVAKYLVAGFTVDRASALPLEPVTFTDTSSGWAPAGWNWSFGDGSFSEEQNPVHAYQNPGTYSVSLTVSTGAGLSDTLTEGGILEITAPPTETQTPAPGGALSADFTSDLTGGQAPLTIRFTDLSTGNPDRWNWSFGDGTSSGEQNPTHMYQDPGTYSVSLTITDKNGTTDTLTRADYLVITSPAAETPPTLTPCTGDGRGLIEIRAPPGSEFAEYGPDGYGTGMTDNPYVPIDPSGQTCLSVDGCGAGFFQVTVRLPNGTIRQSPDFRLDFESTWNADRNGCYYLFDATVEPAPAPAPTPALPLPPTYFWSGGDGGEGSNNMDNHMIRSFDLSGVSIATLRFNATYDIESGYDSGSVDVSPDGGTTWNTLTTYTGDTTGGNAVTTPTIFTVDLSPYAGNSNVLIDFRYTTDYSVFYSGWNISEIDLPEIGFTDTASAWDPDCTGWYGTGWILEPAGSSIPTCSYTPRPTPTPTPSPSPTPVPNDCMGDGRGMIEIRAPSDSQLAAFGPWGFMTGNGGDPFVPIHPSGQSCLIIDGCWGEGAGLYGWFNITVRLPDGTTRQSPDFSLDHDTTWNADKNACYYLFDATATLPPTITPTPTPGPSIPFPAAGGTFTSIATGPGLKLDPAIDGNRIVWTENNDIYLYDILTGGVRQVTTDPSAQTNPQISGDKVVYMDGRKGYWHVFMTDLTAGTDTPIGSGTVSEIYPDISGNRIVWMDARNHRNEIWLYDLSTGVERKIANSAVNPHQPAISGDKVTFTDVRNGNTDIYLFDITTGTETRITSDPGYQVYSDIGGNIIAWADARNGGYADVYMYDLATRTETHLSSSTGSEQWPRVSGNLLAWQWGSPSNGDHIVLYDLRNRTEIQVTPAGGFNDPPDVSGNRVVWVQREAGNYTVMLFTWSGEPVKFLAADFSVSRRSIPALEPLIFNDTSVGMPPVSWEWDFGDGTTSLVQHPVHTYQTPGSYAVRLNVSGGPGLNDSLTRPGFIEVTGPLTTVPVPAFDADMTIGKAPLTVVFHDQSTGYPFTYLWDFGDGTTSAQRGSVTHLYTSPGVYTVSLTVSNHVGPNTTVRRDYINVESLIPMPSPPPLPPAPVIQTLSPVSTSAGGDGFTLQINGANFDSRSEIQWNGRGITTLVVSSTKVQAQIPASFLLQPGTITVKVLSYNGPRYSNPQDFYIGAVSLTPAPTPAPANRPYISVEGGNTVNVNQGLPLTIRTLANGNPYPVDTVEVRVNGVLQNLECSGTADRGLAASSQSCPLGGTYTFNRNTIGDYTVRVVAIYGSWRDEVDKIITVTGPGSATLLASDMLEKAANEEIDEAETIAAEKTIDWVFKAGTSVTVFTLFNSLNMEQVIIDSYGDIERWYMVKTGIIDLYEGTIKQGISSGGSLFRMLGYYSLQEYLENQAKQVMEDKWGVKEYRRDISDNQLMFTYWILDNKPMLVLRSDLERIFLMARQPIYDVVETAVIDKTRPGEIGGGLTMKGASDTYDLLGAASFWINVALAIGIIVAVIALFLSGVGVVAAIPAIIWIATNVALISQGSLLISGFLTLMINGGVPIVAQQVSVVHLGAIHDIQGKTMGASQVPLTLSAQDTTVFNPAQILSTGQSFVVTPDGRIVHGFSGGGSYTPRYPGTYSVVAYQNYPVLFADSAETVFTVIQPKVSMIVSPWVVEHTAYVGLHVCNGEAIALRDLTSVVVIKNSSEGPVYGEGKQLSLEPGECRDIQFSAELPETDVYTGTALLYYSMLEPIQQTSFPLRVDGATVEDLSIVNVNVQDEYSPLDYVGMNVTLEPYAPDMTFDLVIPSLNYRKQVTINGTTTVPVLFPPPEPGHYMVVLMAEKNGRVLDSQIVGFVIRAEGVGIVTVLPGSVYYPAKEPVPVTMEARDLLMNPLDARIQGTVIDPQGTAQQPPVIKSEDGNYTFIFNPPVEGTYVIKSTGYKEGWRILGDSSLVIVGNKSSLTMEVARVNSTIVARAYANGLPASCEITLTSADVNITRFAGNGIATFNWAGSFELKAEQMFYEPAYYTYISPDTLPWADFTLNQTTGHAPLAVQFTDTSQGLGITSWTWAFGDNSFAYEQNPVHVYQDPGTYSVTLTVANKSGSNYVTLVDSITVSEPLPPVAGFTSDMQSGKVPLTVTFSDASTGEHSSWSWDFGDGGTSGDENPAHEYLAPGTYDVSLKITGRGGSHTKTEAGFITVTPKIPPVANFMASPRSGQAPLKVSFTDLSEGKPASWEWSFGDGASDSVQHPIHEYATAGTYSVSLTVTNPDGTHTKREENYVTVKPPAPPVPPVARFTAAPQFGKVPLTVSFRDRSTGLIDSWHWTFGDGGTSDLQAPYHVYSRAGLYMVRLKVSNGAGSDTAWSLVFVLPRWWPWW